MERTVYGSALKQRASTDITLTAILMAIPSRIHWQAEVSGATVRAGVIDAICEEPALMLKDGSGSQTIQLQ
jgi:hypothetical protein